MTWAQVHAAWRAMVAARESYDVATTVGELDARFAELMRLRAVWEESDREHLKQLHQARLVGAVERDHRAAAERGGT